MSTDQTKGNASSARSNSFSQQSQTSDDSQTAADFLRNQELLEADAREALPYSIDSCTKILGPLRQNVFACLTCNPSPSKGTDEWKPAGVCYACSVQCHGQHTLVEIFQKRNFTCDCGTTRVPRENPCNLRTNEETNTKGNVHSEEPDANNKYNKNFGNIFCGCECDYDPFQQKGTMFQCLGLGTHETGGCGEDWYHPGCLVGMGPSWFENMERENKKPPANGANGKGLATISEDKEDQTDARPIDADAAVVDEEEEPPMPPGFPDEEDFEGFLCYKCVDSNPWIKRYAGTPGFLPPVFFQPESDHNTAKPYDDFGSRKRKADSIESDGAAEVKRKKSDIEDSTSLTNEAKMDSSKYIIENQQAPKAEGEAVSGCKLPNFPTPKSGQFSLFFKEGFREQLCHCSSCYPILNAHPQLLEEEETYEPPISEGAASQHGGSTHGSGSLLERGESALRNIDRVRAIEGVMAYNHLKEQLKPFFQQFAESGKAVGAEDIKAYFSKLRGDDQGIKEAGQAAADSGSGNDNGDKRHEQSGY